MPYSALGGTQLFLGIWRAAASSPKSRLPGTTIGTVKVGFAPELPFLRRWLIGERIYLYSVYLAHPGVGVEGPVFAVAENLDEYPKDAYRHLTDVWNRSRHP